MSFEVVLSPAASDDLDNLHGEITQAADVITADAFIHRIIMAFATFSDFPHRGTRRDDLGPGYRTYGWRKRITFVLRVVGQRVEIGGVFYGGRDFETVMALRDFDA